jgi:hypothetical protein
VNGIRHTLVGSNHTDIWGGFQINRRWELDSDDFVMPHGPFGVAESATIDLLFTNLNEVGGCAFGGDPITSVGFRHGLGRNDHDRARHALTSSDASRVDRWSVDCRSA